MTMKRRPRRCDVHVFTMRLRDFINYKRLTLFFYKNVIFFAKPSKEIEIATNKITTVDLV